MSLYLLPHCIYFIAKLIYISIPECNCIQVHTPSFIYHKPRLKHKTFSLPTPERSLEFQPADSIEEEGDSKSLEGKLRETAASIREQTKAIESTKEERKKETTSWLVVLHNDDIHSFQFVTETLAQCIPQLSLANAHTITVQAHSNGQATVLATWKDRANMYCESLQKHGLTVSTMYVKQDKE